ncbi:DUF4430 domain-containing protein [Clostridium sp.]|uniref:DUF4430 domain-containing protein n=1 Tax=Clostridium sp. TaxID=1506 RepID=UPI00346402F8
MRKTWSKIIALLVCIVFFITGCGKPNSNNDKDKQVITVSEKNILSEDGIVSEDIMSGISGVDKVFSFEGMDSSGIKYTWFYDGKKVQNPIEQKLKVEFSKENLDDIKIAANNATVGLEMKLDKMQLAAQVQLSIILTEKWDADKILLCKYIDGKVQKMDDVKIENTDNGDKECTKLTFEVTEADGTYYLLGGKTKKASDKEVKNEEDSQKEKSENSKEQGSVKEQAGVKEQASVKEKPDDKASVSPGDNSSKKYTCTISIECGTILNNRNDLNKNKVDFVPSNGWILGSKTVEFTPGETVYDILGRVCKESKIQMEASFTPMYSSYYVEGINQLYEFDCGNLSGWMYRVNGWYPNYGCSKYEVNDGDNIEWKYTCDLGRDVGGYIGE